jgi:hypothetical protein
MNKNLPLLLDPSHVLPPDVVLNESNTMDTGWRKESESLRCEKCGTALKSNYHILFGIPPSPFIVEAVSCESIDYEKYIEISNV